MDILEKFTHFAHIIIKCISVVCMRKKILIRETEDKNKRDGERDKCV